MSKSLDQEFDIIDSHYDPDNTGRCAVCQADQPWKTACPGNSKDCYARSILMSESKVENVPPIQDNNDQRRQASNEQKWKQGECLECHKENVPVCGPRCERCWRHNDAMR